MSKISESNSYSIDNLVTAGESDWKDLERFARLQCQHKLNNSGDETKPPLERIQLAVEDVLIPYVGIGKYLNIPKTLPHYNVLLNLASSNNRTPYVPLRPKTLLFQYRLGSWAKDKIKLCKSLQKVTNAFATSADYEQAFSKIATKNNLIIFKDHWSQQDCSWAKGEYLSVKIEQRIKNIMGRLEYGLGSKTKCQEAWWNCLWLFMEPFIETMRKIKKRINNNVPLYPEQIETLNYYISHGYPVTDSSVENDGKHKIQIILKPHTPMMILNSPFEVMSVLLLVQPAFDLSQKLQNTFSKPRFIQQCHAPSCYKSFYSYYNRQVVCAGKGNKKTKCALEWQQYRNWLEILGKKPEKEWNNIERINEFLSRNH